MEEKRRELQAEVNLKRSVSLGDEDTLRLSCIEDTATVSTSLSGSTGCRTPLHSTEKSTNNFATLDATVQHDWCSDHVNYREGKACSEDSGEFRWLLFQERQRSFGGSMGFGIDQWKNNDLYITAENCTVQRPSDTVHLNNTAMSNGALIPVLICVIFVFFLVTTALLIAVIYLSTQGVSYQENYTKPSYDRPPVNMTTIYAQRCQQNLAVQNEISERLLSSFRPKNIKENIRWLTENIHVAGTKENAELMMKIAETYRNYGYDVRTYSYSVLLNYPSYDKPNRIEYKSDQDGWIEVSNGLSEVLGPKEAREQQSDMRSRVYWNAYSKNGTALGKIIYVNYGTADDYKRLEKIGVSVSGNIVLCRYGGIFRGDKVQLAEARGAIGLILYSDPFDYTNGRNGEKVFPDQIWLPPSGAQRGTLLKTEGDPETPMVPSKYYAYRTENEESLREQRVMPSIPVMPIGYRDAVKIMQRMDGMQIKVI